MFRDGADSDALAGDAQPEAALREVEGDTEAENENDGSRPDQEGTAVFGDEQHGRFGSIIERDSPLFVATMGCLANVEAGDDLVGGRRRAGRADADDKERVCY